MKATPTTEIAAEEVPTMVDAALDRLRAEQKRTCQLLADAPKCRRLSALYEQEARLWTLLVQHTAEPVYRRAAIEAEFAARARAREYAHLVGYWSARPEGDDCAAGGGAS